MHGFLGCTEDADRGHFTESPYPTKRCPRAAINAVSLWPAVMDLYNHTEGRLGPAVLSMSNVMVEAANAISQGEAWAVKQKTQ